MPTQECVFLILSTHFWVELFIGKLTDDWSLMVDYEVTLYLSETIPESVMDIVMDRMMLEGYSPVEYYGGPSTDPYIRLYGDDISDALIVAGILVPLTVQYVNWEGLTIFPVKE